MKYLAAIIITAVLSLFFAPAYAQINGDQVNLLIQPISGILTDSINYKIGQPVKISFIIENRTDQVITLRFPSGQKYDIWVQKDEQEVWRWSRNRIFTQAFTSITLRPGERRIFEETWKQTGNDNKQVAPGAYDIFGQLTTVPPRPTPVKTQVTVGAGAPVIKQAVVKNITDDPDAVLGQTVSLMGEYRGWRADPNSPACRPGPPVSRADWVFADQTGCIFITGPSSLDPVDDFGKRVAVLGIVRKTAKGRPYIQAKSVQLIKQQDTRSDSE